MLEAVLPLSAEPIATYRLALQLPGAMPLWKSNSRPLSIFDELKPTTGCATSRRYVNTRQVTISTITRASICRRGRETHFVGLPRSAKGTLHQAPVTTSGKFPKPIVNADQRDT